MMAEEQGGMLVSDEEEAALRAHVLAWPALRDEAAQAAHIRDWLWMLERYWGFDFSDTGGAMMAEGKVEYMTTLPEGWDEWRKGARQRVIHRRREENRGLTNSGNTIG